MPYDILGNIRPTTRAQLDHVRSIVMKFRLDDGLSVLDSPGIDLLLRRLNSINVELVPVRLNDVARESAANRLGATVIARGHPPLIWIDFARHCNLQSLADTLFHEAIHATALHLDRFDAQPDPILSPIEYAAEEMVAYIGASAIARFIGYDLGPIFEQNNRFAARHEQRIRAAGWRDSQIEELRGSGLGAARILADRDHVIYPAD